MSATKKLFQLPSPETELKLLTYSADESKRSRLAGFNVADRLSLLARMTAHLICVGPNQFQDLAQEHFMSELARYFAAFRGENGAAAIDYGVPKGSDKVTPMEE